MPRLVAMIVVSVAASLACAAQQQTPSPAAKTETANPVVGQGRITGIVILSDTNKPARGVTIWLVHVTESKTSDPPQESTVTDADGRYSFEGLLPGDYQVRAGLRGYLSPLATTVANGSTPSDRTGELISRAINRVKLRTSETAKYDIVFHHGAALSGHVLYDDGSPVIGAALEVEKLTANGQSSPSYENVSRPSYLAGTDDRGNFRIATLAPGTYVIAAMPLFQTNDIPSMGLSFGDEELRRPGTIAIFSGDTVHRAKAKTYELREGDEIGGIEITVPLAKLHKVYGNVAAEDGRIPNTGMVTLIDVSDTEIHFRTAINRDGDFSFAAIPSGTYKVSVSNVLITKPAPPSTNKNTDDDDIPTNAFAPAESSVIVKDSDVVDLHFNLAEIPLPPIKPEDPDDPK